MITPIGNKVLIKPDAPLNVTQGGILISNPIEPSEGEIIAVSKDIEMPVKVGDRVNFEGGGLKVDGLLLISVEKIRYIL